MKHFFTTRVRVILIAAVLLAAGLAIISSLTHVSIPDILVKTVLAPIRAGASRLTDSAEQMYDYIFSFESLKAENEMLKEKVAQLEKDARSVDSLIKENERLRSAMGMIESNEEFKLVDSYIISRSSQQWSNTFTINKGASSGIQVGMCAVTANNEVVGVVSEAGPNYAVVKTVMDSSLEISATISASGYNGMVQGGYASGQDGLLRMDYLPSNSVIRNNDQVVTSGSTVYPRNLIIGYVVDADFDDIGVAKYALLKPAVNVGSLEQVFIVTQYRVG